jgi:hypothetical protein
MDMEALDKEIEALEKEFRTQNLALFLIEAPAGAEERLANEMLRKIDCVLERNGLTRVEYVKLKEATDGNGDNGRRVN